VKFPFSAGQVLLLKSDINWALNSPNKERTHFVNKGDVVLMLEMRVSYKEPKEMAASVLHLGEIYTTLARPQDWIQYWEAVTDPV
jgi:hypothetical protein